MKETIRVITVLAIICVLAGALLAGVRQITKGPIDEAVLKEKRDALARVLPEYDNVPLATVCPVTNGGLVYQFYVARKDGEFVGAAVEVSTTRCYGDLMKLMVGISDDDRVKAVELLQPKGETPGLGTKVEQVSFKGQFTNSATDSGWCRIVKDGGRIVPVTGATVSSKAMTGAIAAGIDAFAAGRDSILAWDIELTDDEEQDDEEQDIP